jgi:hypothetical protein
MGQMGADVLKNNLANAARTYQWDFQIPAPVGTGDTDVWLLRAQNVHIPGKSFEDIHIDYKATGGYNIPGREQYDHIFPVTLLEGEDALGFTAINSWMEQIRSAVGGTGSPDASLKTDAVLTMTDEQENPWLAIKLVGIYPKSVDNVDLNYNSSGVVKFSVTFSYDRWENMTVSS